MGLISFLLYDLILPMLVFAAVIGVAVYFVQTSVHVPIIQSRQQPEPPPQPVQQKQSSSRSRTPTPPPSITGKPGIGVVVNASTPAHSGADTNSKIVPTKPDPRKESPKRKQVAPVIPIKKTPSADPAPAKPVEPPSPRVASFESLPNSPNAYSVSLDEINDELHDNFSFLQRLEFQRAKKALILGLDGAGKSAVLAAICGDRTEYSPTNGFHVLHLLIDKDLIEIWEVGGSKKLRPYWQTFYKHADIVIYVIDAHNYQRIGEADKILRALLKDDQLKTIPFIVVANKQDKKGALVAKALAKVLQLPLESDRVTFHEMQVHSKLPHHGVRMLRKLLKEKTDNVKIAAEVLA